MVTNAHGHPLCKHSRPEWQHRNSSYGAKCGWWCEWRTVVYAFLAPAAVIITVLFALVPHSDMFGFQ